MRFTASAFLGLALFLFGNASWAQTPPQPNSAPELTEEEKEKEEKAWSYFFLEEVLQRSCDDPTLRSTIALPQPKLILETTDDGQTRVKARVGLEIQKEFVLNLEVASPRNPSGETTLASLDGLSNGTTAELALSWFLVPWKDYKEAALKTAEIAAGEVSADREWRVGDYSNPVMSRPSPLAALGPVAYKKVMESWQKEMKKLIPVLTVQANAEQKEFQFVSGSTLALRKEAHTDYQLTASLGGYFRGAYGSVNYRRGNEFKAGRTAELCSPFGSTGLQECRDFVVAPPKKGTAEFLEFEIRRLFGTFGVAAQLTRDLEANVTAVEIPIYFLQKLGASEMELNGGVAVKWRSDTDDYSLSVFIGPALSTVLRMAGRGDR